MGQQQLLLVILVTIIVGIATVVAINTFGSAADNANLDAVRQDLASAASAAQGYYMKPNALGGGGNQFDGITFAKMGSVACNETTPDQQCTNENGVYDITGATGDVLTITGDPATAENPALLTATIGPNTFGVSP